MSDESSRPRRLQPRRFVTRRDHLLAEIDALAIELEDASDATSSGHAPVAARADYMRARQAHHRAAMMWISSTGPEQLALVSDALRTCRAALESSRAALRG
jgi:hypothetical protein